MISPLYNKIHAKAYRPFLTIQDKRVLEWWASTLRSIKPRIATPKPRSPELIIYTDAATLTSTISAALFGSPVFLREREVIIG